MKQAQEGHPSAMRMAFTYDVFLSHSSKDKDTVREIAERLQADGLRVWFDEWEIRPGGNIPVAIERGLEASRTLVLSMSAYAFDSDWATLESQTHTVTVTLGTSPSASTNGERYARAKTSESSEPT